MSIFGFVVCLMTRLVRGDCSFLFLLSLLPPLGSMYPLTPIQTIKLVDSPPLVVAELLVSARGDGRGVKYLPAND